MDIAVNPTLIIALGGTGQNILNRYRRRLRQRLGTDILPLVQYIYIDTDQGNTEVSDNQVDGIPIGLSPTVAAELADLNSTPAREMELASWVSEDALSRLHRGTLGGAQGFRQLGHISFLASSQLRVLQTQIQERVGKLLEARQTQVGKQLEGLNPRYLQLRLQGSGQHVMIYVLASAGGGTGSSTWIDVGYFVRRCLRLARYDDKCKLIGIACLAAHTFPPAHQYRYNSAGVLLELDHYLTRPDYRAAYPLAFPREPLHGDLPNTDPLYGVARQLPFKYQYVCQPATLHGDLLDPANPPAALGLLEQKVAELLLSESVFAAPPGAMEANGTDANGGLSPLVQEVLSGELESRREDYANRVNNQLYRDRYPTDLMTFGISTWEFPAAMHHIMAFGKAIRGLAERWTAEPPAVPGTPPDRTGHRVADAQLDRWVRELGLLADVRQYAEHRARSLNDDLLTRALLEDPESDPRQALLAAAQYGGGAEPPKDPQAWLSGRRAAVDELLQRVADRPPVGAPGSVHARLRDRAAQLAGWSPEGYPNRLARSLLETAFDAEAGIGVALVLASRLTDRLIAERDYLQLCLADLTAQPGPTSARATAPARHDWLLVGWRARLAPEGETFVEEQAAWHHANQRLARLALEAKQQICGQCAEAIKRLQGRLLNLREYFQKWREQAPNPDDPAFQLTAEERRFVIRDDELVERFARLPQLSDRLGQLLSGTRLFAGLMAEVERGLPPQAADGEPALLAEGIPFDRRRNRPDFSFLEDLERAVFEAIGSQRDGPYTQEIIPLLTERAAQSGDRLPNLQAEASPLLKFDEGNPDYQRDCRFNGPVEWWQLQSDHRSVDHATFVDQMSRQQAVYQFNDTPDAKMSLLDSSIPSVVTLVRHRIGIVSALIEGYRPDEVLRMLRDAAHPAVTDTRILPPMNPAVRWRAGLNILGGLVLGPNVVFTLDDRQFTFQYTVQSESGFQQTFPVRLPMDFRAAYDMLARKEDDLEELEALIRAKVRDLGDEASVRLDTAIGHLDRLKNTDAPDRELQRFDVWSTMTESAGVYLTGFNHDDGINLLHNFALEYGIKSTVPYSHPYAVFLNAGDRKEGGVATVPGWYCTTCGEYHGKNIPPANRTCDHCRRRQRAGGAPEGSL